MTGLTNRRGTTGAMNVPRRFFMLIIAVLLASYWLGFFYSCVSPAWITKLTALSFKYHLTLGRIPAGPYSMGHWGPVYEVDRETLSR